MTYLCLCRTPSQLLYASLLTLNVPMCKPDNRTTTYLPNGLRLPTRGTRAFKVLKSSIENGMSASLASARQWSTRFVDPPNAMHVTIAFSNAFRVIIWRQVVPDRIIAKSASTCATHCCFFTTEISTVSYGVPPAYEVCHKSHRSHSATGTGFNDDT